MIELNENSPWYAHASYGEGHGWRIQLDHPPYGTNNKAHAPLMGTYFESECILDKGMLCLILQIKNRPH